MKRFLFLITVFELFIGGGGRLTEIGPITFRMLLYATCLSVWFLTSLNQSTSNRDGQKLAFGFAILYLLIHVNGLLIGAAKGVAFAAMMSDMQQSLYWLAAPFFASMISLPNMVNHIAILVKFSGLVLAIPYLLIIAFSFLGLINLSSIYPVISASGEFYFRGLSFFFYKGFLYLGVAAVFFAAMKDRYWVLISLALLSALVLTLTRGFILSTSIALLFLFAHQRRWGFFVGMISIFIVSLFLVFIYLPNLDVNILSERHGSTSQRVDDFNFIVDNVSPSILLWGDGFGTLINDRQSIENTFLWAIWRFGFIGLIFWLLPLVLCTRYFTHISRQSDGYNSACAFYFATILVYLQTSTNPYLNNPIGLSFVIISLFSLRKLSKDSLQDAFDCRSTNLVIKL